MPCEVVMACTAAWAARFGRFERFTRLSEPPRIHHLALCRPKNAKQMWQTLQSFVGEIDNTFPQDEFSTLCAFYQTMDDSSNIQDIKLINSRYRILLKNTLDSPETGTLFD